MPETVQNKTRASLFRDRNFRWLMSGSVVSLLGDQFTLIALPWLVLKMTGDTLVLGTVLAVMSIPRALLLMVGGALVDRHSPKQVLMLTKYASTLLLGLLALLVLTGHLSLWAVYGIALALGTATAFSLPSATSILPHAIAREDLPAANSIVMMVRQLSMFAGPLLAGLLIGWFASKDAGGALKEARGLGLSFAFDAFSFALSGWTLSRVKVAAPASVAASTRQPMLHAVAEGLRYCWNDRSLRICYSYWAAVAFFISGPIQVAIPVLAAQVGHGATAFGALAGANGAGTLLGMLVNGIRPGLRFRSLGSTILLLDALIGLLFVPLGLIHATWQGVLLLLVIGTLSGFLIVTIYTWLQRYVEPSMLGRSMGLFMFNFMGIAPIAAALAGWLMRSVTLGQLFAGCGLMLVGIVAITFAVSDMHRVSDMRMA